MQLHRRFRQSLLFVVLPAFVACGETRRQEPSPEPLVLLTTEEVMETYDLYRSGRYSEYVARMASCEGMPSDYLKQMATALKQHAAEVRKENGNVTSAACSRVQTGNDGRSATAFINVTYADKSSEELLLHFVLVGRQWKLR